MKETRLFFTVDGTTENIEIFETLEEAREWAQNVVNPTIKVAIVKNAYKEEDLFTDSGLADRWNYEDFADTFEFIKTIK